ncbi:radical SAM protein [Fenollaria timonensis]|uniref:radical SAM protein n=1 Tax=Fenollaria timonensis TaxID=1723384 RepID=UPI00071CB9A9|nr:radical SAM protein [Fenollaria timonensis]
MHYDTLAISLNSNCNANCKICCGMPKSNQVLNDDIAFHFLRGLKYNSDIKRICLTGGEIFLDINKVYKWIKFINESNKKAYCVSNGFWGYDIKEANQIVKNLKQLGLNQLTLSYDEYHNEFISIECIINILEACKRQKLPVSIQTVILNKNNNKKWINDLVSYLPDINILFFPCYQVGNASKNFSSDMFIKSRDKKGLLCEKSGTFMIEADGTVWPCCSPYINETELNIDNIYLSQNANIDSALKKIRDNKLLYCLRNFGFDYFVDLAENKLDIELPKKFVSSCELCAYLFSKINFKRFNRLIN